MVTPSTAARSPKTAWIQHACASRDHADQRGAVSRRFPKKSFRTPHSPNRKGVLRTFESKTLFPKIASPVAPRRFGPSQESDTGALSIATSQIDATAACMCMGRDARHAHGGACSGPSAWRPASVEAPVARVDKVAHAANSAQVRMRLRSRLRLAKVARVVDAIDFGPWRNAGGSVPAAAHSLRDFQRAIVRWAQAVC